MKVSNKEEEAKWQVKFETAEKEKEIGILKEQQKADDLKFYVLIIGSILFAIIAFLIFNRQYFKNLKNKEIHRSKEALIKSKLENKELEKEKLEQQLHYRKSELTDLALNMSQKDIFYEELKNELTKLSRSEKFADSNKLREIALRIKQKLAVDKDRHNFNQLLEKNGALFYEKITSLNPTITAGEKQLAGLLRLGFSSKEIAVVLNISSQSADVFRSRLRKKLNINAEIDLQAYFSNV